MAKEKQPKLHSFLQMHHMKRKNKMGKVGMNNGTWELIVKYFIFISFYCWPHLKFSKVIYFIIHAITKLALYL